MPDDRSLAQEPTPATGPVGAAAPPAHGPVDRIRLVGITAFGYHGVLEGERRTGQTFSADVVLHVDTRPAAAGDRLDLTVDYGGMAEQVAAVLAGDPADLIETVAERIAAVALANASVAAVDVVVHKPQAPITVPFGDVTVEIHRDRRHLPSLVVVPLATASDEHVHLPPVPAPPVPAPPVPAPAVATLGVSVSHVPQSHVPQSHVPQPHVPQPHVPESHVPESHVPESHVPEGSAPESPISGGLLFVGPDPAEDPLDVVPAEPVDVVLALGSNLGPSQETLREAVAELDAVHGLEITAIAPLARTASVGGPEQADYLNTVLLGRTVLSPRALLAACQGVEARHGRVREERWGARTLDVDIVVHGTTLAVDDDLELPHPRAHQRAFVLEPWAQVSPDAVLPGLGGGPVAALARTAPDRDGIRWLALDWWSPQPERG